MTERKRLKAVRRRNEKVKSHNFETKTLKRVPILSLYPTMGERENRILIIKNNKILRGIRINAI